MGPSTDPGREEWTMTRAGTRLLDSGERLPTVAMETVAHGRITVPDRFGENWGVLLLYRAHW
jgi:hypothetical protein